MTHYLAALALAAMGVSALYATWATLRSAAWITPVGGLFLAAGVVCGMGLLYLAWAVLL